MNKEIDQIEDHEERLRLILQKSKEQDLESSISDVQSVGEQNNKKQSVFEFTTITILLLGTLGALFYYCSKYQSGSDQCIYLKLWSLYFSYFCLIIILSRLFIFLPTYYFALKGEGNKVKICLRFIVFYQTFEVCASIIFLIGLTIMFLLDEPCSYLRLLTKIFLLTIYSCLILICCCTVCIAAIVGGAAINSHNY